MKINRKVSSECEKCGHVNEYSAGYFINCEVVIDEHVIANCESCKTTLVLDLLEVDIH